MKMFQHFFRFIMDIIRSRHLILQMTKQDFRMKYLGSQLGMLWAFIQPAMTILIFWFVFDVGFKAMPVENFPFILWLMAGITPWFFFSDGLMQATWSVQENAFLVKKVVFRVSILPIIKILSALVIHVFFVCVLFLMFIGYGYFPDWHALQIFYYLFATIVLLLGLSWLTSALVLFLRDIGQMVMIAIQFGFWVTPVFWSLRMIPEQYRFFLQLNPVYYLTEGYRNSLIHHIWFWEDPWLTLYFWLVALGLFALGAIVFHRLRPHFADVL